MNNEYIIVTTKYILRFKHRNWIYYLMHNYTTIPEKWTETLIFLVKWDHPCTWDYVSIDWYKDGLIFKCWILTYMGRTWVSLYSFISTSQVLDCRQAYCRLQNYTYSSWNWRWKPVILNDRLLTWEGYCILRNEALGCTGTVSLWLMVS